MEFSSTDLTTILQESLKVQIHKNELENYASKIMIATSHRGQYKIRPCNLVNYTVEVHNKPIHFFLSLSVCLSHTHTEARACTHASLHSPSSLSLPLPPNGLKSSSDSESLSESEVKVTVWPLVRLTRIWVVKVREGISGSLWIRSVWKWQNKVLQMTTTSLISLLRH